MPTSDFELIEKQLETIAPTVYFGLGAEWKTLADALAEAGNVTGALGEQKAEFEKHVTTIKETYREIIGNTSFVAVDRWDVSDPGTFVIADFGCVEIAQDDLGLRFPEVADGYKNLPFEQIGELSTYDVILYPVDAQGRPKRAFAPVVETNTWKALPTVNSGRALGVFCPGNNSYGPSCSTWTRSIELWRRSRPGSDSPALQHEGPGTVTVPGPRRRARGAAGPARAERDDRVDGDRSRCGVGCPVPSVGRHRSVRGP